MSFHFNHFSLRFLAILFLLTACGTPPVASPPATPQAVFMSYPPELRPYAEAIAACARQYPDIAIYLNETVTDPTPDQQTTLFLALHNQPPALSGWYATLLAEDALTVIVNQQNPLTAISSDDLHLIFNGRIPNWDAVANRGTINVWTYPAGSMLRQIFDNAVLSTELTTSQAWIAPDPQAMLEAVADDPHAIGYLPASWLHYASPEISKVIHQLQLDRNLKENLRQPVIALTEGEPQAALRTLLLCYQAGQ